MKTFQEIYDKYGEIHTFQGDGFTFRENEPGQGEFLINDATASVYLSSTYDEIHPIFKKYLNAESLAWIFVRFSTYWFAARMRQPSGKISPDGHYNLFLSPLMLRFLSDFQYGRKVLRPEFIATSRDNTQIVTMRYFRERKEADIVINHGYREEEILTSFPLNITNYAFPEYRQDNHK